VRRWRAGRARRGAEEACGGGALPAWKPGAGRGTELAEGRRSERKRRRRKEKGEKRKKGKERKGNRKKENKGRKIEKGFRKLGEISRKIRREVKKGFCGFFWVSQIPASIPRRHVRRRGERERPRFRKGVNELSGTVLKIRVI
jgi:hypothetical protein